MQLVKMYTRNWPQKYGFKFITALTGHSVRLWRTAFPAAVSIQKTSSAAFASLYGTKILRVLFLLLSLMVGAERAFAQSTSDRAFEAGMSFYNTKNFTAAINQWEKLLADDPNYAEKEKVWFYIASAVLQANAGHKKAAEYLDKIISQPIRSPYYEQSLFSFGLVFFQYAEQLRNSGDLNQATIYATAAKEKFDQFLTEFPNSPNLPVVLHSQTQIAVIYLKSATETIRYTQMAMNGGILKDTSADNQRMWANCRFYHAWALGQLGQEAQARSIFGEFIRDKDPDRGPKSLYELAFIFYRSGQYRQTLSELSPFNTTFPNADAKTRLEVQRLQAMCHYQLEEYEQAKNALIEILGQQKDENSVPIGDHIYFVLCHIKTRSYQKAAEWIDYLERNPVYTVYTDGIGLLKAYYFAETQQPQNAVDLLNTILGTRKNPVNNTISFDKRPFDSEVANMPKCGLTEEHFLRAASLLAICYAKMGQKDVAWQVYSAMEQVSNEMYGRYSPIRERTLTQLSQIQQTPSGTSPTMPGTVTPPLTGGTPSHPIVSNPIVTTPGLGTGGTGNSSNWNSGSGSSIVQPPGGNNSLANRPLTLEDEDDLLKKLEARARNADGNEKEIDDVIADLGLLLNNRNTSKYGNARAAVLRGEMFLKKNEIRRAVEMFEMAYEELPPGSPHRDTPTFEQAAFRLGQDAEREEEFKKAALYYSEAYATKAGQDDRFRAGLLYRWGSALLYVPGQRQQALWCFNEIFENEKTSKYWSHAALQLATDDFKSRKYVACEKIIDELIEKKPDQAILDRVLYLKGELALQNRQWDIAATSFDAISVFIPTSPFVGLAQQKQVEARSKVR